MNRSPYVVCASESANRLKFIALCINLHLHLHYQIMVSGRRTYTQHYGTGPMGMETSCRGGIGHQQAQAQGMNPGNEEEEVICNGNIPPAVTAKHYNN